MKRLFSYVFISTLLLACADDDTGPSTIAGKWKLTQVLVDPGDGSGTFSDVDSDKTIDFLSNKTFLSNGDICHMFSVTESESTGIYSNEDALIYPTNCNNVFGDGGLNYYLENDTLTIYYPCIEACAERYRRIR